MRRNALPSAPTDNISAVGHKKAAGSDELATPQEVGHVTHVDGGILNYVRERMHCRTVTPEVKRQAAAFEKEMNRMQGW